MWVLIWIGRLCIVVYEWYLGGIGGRFIGNNRGGILSQQQQRSVFFLLDR